MNYAEPKKYSKSMTVKDVRWRCWVVNKTQNQLAVCLTAIGVNKTIQNDAYVNGATELKSEEIS